VFFYLKMHLNAFVGWAGLRSDPRVNNRLDWGEGNR